MDNYDSIVCALTHDLETCERCKKCKGDSSIEIRLNLVKELSKKLNKELPWVEEGYND